MVGWATFIPSAGALLGGFIARSVQLDLGR